MPHTEFVIDAAGRLVEAPASTSGLDLPRPQHPRFAVTFDDGRTTVVEGADAFQPEGSLVTFFATGSSRGEIDSWSRRIASYRSSLIVAVERLDATPAAEQPEAVPQLVAA